ncbi:MAG: protein O-GlcNAcase [Atopostipes sp.]|nr:protein O-GlcNAcase [Atopostipes sp.]
MFKRILVFLSTLFLVLLTFNLKSVEASSSDNHYEFYPKIQDTNLQEKKHSLNELESYVFSDHLKENSKKYFTELIPGLEEEAYFIEDKKQALIVLEDDHSPAEEFILENYSVDDDLFNKKDAYYLNTADDLIIYAKDNEAAYHAISTLKQIMNQKDDIKESLAIHDYADSNLRGFIEGFYGIPWTNEERKSLMDFGRDFKLNSYIFAPKEDPYHNEQWRKLYPEDQVNELKKLLSISQEKNIEFIWTIHPFMKDSVNFEENYEEDLETIIDKFEQLYDIGIRQFGVLADDVDQEGLDARNQLKLMRDLNKWNTQKVDTKNLIFVPSAYNKEWAEQLGNYFKDLADLPENIQVMWTGNEVVGKINQETVDYFKDSLNRDPIFWLNWPVNDNIPVRLSLGKTEMINSDSMDLAGVITNPMKEAEASKGALFTIADYSWNSEDFDRDTNWEDSFKYIEGKEDDNLRFIAQHLNDQAPVIEFKESESLKEDLEQYLEDLEDDSVNDEQRNRLSKEFKKISKAITELKEDAENKEYIEEINPWLNSLRDLADSSLVYLEAEQALTNDNEEEFENYFFEAVDLKEQSENYEIETIDGPMTVQAGSKRLIPFNSALNGYLSQNAPSDGSPVFYILGAIIILAGLAYLYFKQKENPK